MCLRHGGWLEWGNYRKECEERGMQAAGCCGIVGYSNSYLFLSFSFSLIEKFLGAFKQR